MDARLSCADEFFIGLPAFRQLLCIWGLTILYAKWADCFMESLAKNPTAFAKSAIRKGKNAERMATRSSI